MLIKSRKSQRGMTAVGIAAILVLCGFVLMIVAKLTPAYLDKYKVDAALEGLLTDDRAKDTNNKRMLTSLILRKLQIDDVDYVTEKEIEFDKIDGGTRVIVKYEHRVPMWTDLEAVVMYENSVDIVK